MEERGLCWKEGLDLIRFKTQKYQSAMSCTYLPNASHPGDLENEEGGGRGCKVYWDKFGFLVLQTDILILVPNMVLVRRRQWHPTPVLLPRKSHGWKSLVGCSPWGGWESGATERLHFHFSLSCNGEGNGNPLQCSCLENPTDSRAWWAAVYGVVQSQTRLKQLSSSSMILVSC